MIRHLVVKNGMVTQHAMYHRPANGELLFLLATALTENETMLLAKTLKLDRRLFRDYTRVPYSRRLSVNPFVFLLKDYYIENGGIATANLLFILTNNMLVIISAKESAYYADLFKATSEKIEIQKPKNISWVLYHFLLEDTEDNYSVLEKTEQELSHLEAKIITPNSTAGGSPAELQSMTALKRRLFRMTRQFGAAIKIVTALRTGTARIALDPQSSALMGDLHETFLHQIDVASSQKDMITDLLTINTSNVSNRLAEVSNQLNVIMKRLAAFALLLMLPTLMTGVYGMNFIYLPLAAHHSGIYFMMAAMLTVVVITALFFRKAKWL